MKTQRLSFALLMLLVLGVPGRSDSSAIWVFDAVTNDPSTAYCARSYFGMASTATDNYDGEHGSDSPIFTPNLSAVFAATYHSSVSDGWTGPDGFYQQDIRGSAPSTPGESKSIQIYVWATPYVPANNDTIWLAYRFNSADFPPRESLSFRLTLRAKPQSISEGPEVGNTWELLVPEGEIELPIYRTDNGLTGYQFELTATAVPEPSSILAMLCGVGGMAGPILRRKQ